MDTINTQQRMDSQASDKAYESLAQLANADHWRGALITQRYTTIYIGPDAGGWEPGDHVCEVEIRRVSKQSDNHRASVTMYRHGMPIGHGYASQMYSPQAAADSALWKACDMASRWTTITRADWRVLEGASTYSLGHRWAEVLGLRGVTTVGGSL